MEAFAESAGARTKTLPDMTRLPTVYEGLQSVTKEYPFKKGK